MSVAPASTPARTPDGTPPPEALGDAGACGEGVKGGCAPDASHRDAGPEPGRRSGGRAPWDSHRESSMYTEFYGLREKPFSLTPNPRFLYLAAPHREALAHLLYGIEQGEGFIAVTGEVGTGKTTLCRTLLGRIGAGAEVAFLFNPSLTGDDLLRAVHLELGLPVRQRSRAELGDQLNRFLLDMSRRGRRVLLIVDEAQNLPTEALEEIRLLSNLETSTSKLIQIVLFGQPELDAVLDSPELRQLRQRVSVRWRLEPLAADEACEYVRHRVRVAAGADRELFSPGALREIRRRSRGIPRLVNLLADRALLAGYAAGSRRVEREHVDQAAREILSARRRQRPRRRWFAASAGRSQ
jgi:general secretion pathway protein A